MTNSGNEFVATRWDAVSGRAAVTKRMQQEPRRLRRSSPVPVWLALMGVVLPTELQLSVGGAKLTAGRLGMLILFIPAVVVLFQSRRKTLISDAIVFAIGIWTIGISTYVGGMESASSAAAESLEFVGGYFVARSFFFGPEALERFLRVLKSLLITAIILAMADSISGRWIVHDTVSSLVGFPSLGAIFRGNTVRAASTFDHPILFGTFCAFCAGILLFSESKTPKRLLWACFCLFGCLLSQSSASLLGLVIVGSIYLYDHALKLYPWRWSLFWAVISVYVLAIFVAAEHPIGWAISHLTLDPATGYYRILIWDAAFSKISEAPFTGFAFKLFNEMILDHTVDSVWLVAGLRFGVPMLVLMVLANVTAMLPAGRTGNKDNEGQMGQMRLAFTLVLLVYMFVGLTVHFWNYAWVFWGLCIGIRASLREWLMKEGACEQSPCGR